MYFFFTQPPTPRISTAGPTLSLHAARPISRAGLADEGLFVHRRSGRDGAAGQHYRYCPQDRVLLAGRADASRGPRRIGGLGSGPSGPAISGRSEEHTSELQSLMRISYAVFCVKKKNKTRNA